MGIKKQWRIHEKGLFNTLICIGLFIVTFFILGFLIELELHSYNNIILCILGIISLPVYLIIKNVLNNKDISINILTPKVDVNLIKLLYGPILYFKMKSYIKGALWLLFILAAFKTNFFMALLFWVIAGWFGKRKLERNHEYASIRKPSSTPGQIHKSTVAKYQSIEIPVIKEIPEGPEYGIAGFIDVETTGLSAKKDEIIEFAISLFCFDKNTGKIIGIVDSYCGLREPTIPIPPEASNVNGIYMKDVKGKDLDYKRINSMLDKAEFFISHNADFDRKFVRVLFPSVNSKIWLCSMNGIDWYGKGFYSKGLQNLLYLHGIQPRISHRASADVESAIQLLACTKDNGENYFSELIKGKIKVQKPSKKMKLGFYNGKHYTEYVETIKILKREGENDAAEKLLLNLIDAIELEATSEGFGVAPWYYEQLAIIYRKQKDYLKEIEILERFAKQKHSPGASTPKLLDRLEKAKRLALRSAPTDIANQSKAREVNN